MNESKLRTLQPRHCPAAGLLAMLVLVLPLAARAAAPATTPVQGAASAVASRSAAPRIEHAWARATPAGVSVAAAYLTVRNPGPKDDQIVALRSALSERVEIHETRMSNGIMRMRQITEATVPAGGSLAFVPGGTHVMLIGLRSPLAPGATVPLVLSFRHAGEISTNAVVQAPGGDPPGQ